MNLQRAQSMAIPCFFMTSLSMKMQGEESQVMTFFSSFDVSRFEMRNPSWKVRHQTVRGLTSDTG